MQIWQLTVALMFLPALAVLIVLGWLCLGIWTALDHALAIIQGATNKVFDELFFD